MVYTVCKMKTVIIISDTPKCQCDLLASKMLCTANPSNYKDMAAIKLIISDKLG